MKQSVNKEKQPAFSIAKTDEEKQYIFGWAQVAQLPNGTPIVDHQGDIVEPCDLEEAAYHHVLYFRSTGEQHKLEFRSKGKLIESCVFTQEKQEAIGIPPNCVNIGWWVGYHIDDATTWAKVKRGEYGMFSVEGTGQREEILQKRCKQSLFMANLAEIMKFNPYHDAKGRFSDRERATSFPYSPGKSKEDNLASTHERNLSGKDELKSEVKVREFTNESEAFGYTVDYFERKIPVYTGQQMKACQVYTGQEYESINALLRGVEHGENLPDETRVKYEKAYREHIENISAAIDKSPTHEPITVYRGMSRIFVEGKLITASNADLLIGSVIRDKGFVSTSLTKTTAQEFAGNNGIILKIVLPKGTKAYMPDGSSLYPDECETILQRGSGFRVTGIDKSRIPPILYAEYVTG